MSSAIQRLICFFVMGNLPWLLISQYQSVEEPRLGPFDFVVPAILLLGAYLSGWDERERDRVPMIPFAVYGAVSAALWIRFAFYIEYWWHALRTRRVSEEFVSAFWIAIIVGSTIACCLLGLAGAKVGKRGFPYQ